MTQLQVLSIDEQAIAQSKFEQYEYMQGQADWEGFQRQLPTAGNPPKPCGQATPTVLSPPQVTGSPVG
ncbi:hypothetical protein [Mastigocladopsis repens]|uniref:hypothetical protein n=1 Tax=Mastigocladopsis repens TaxID=221287 RepID=UPI0002F59AB2|nr:hypothetical protein [Mastigocladopsis repens]